MKLKNRLNYMKLRDKLLFMYIFSVFIPIVATNIIFYNVTTDNIRNQKIRDAKMALDNIKNDLRVTIDQAVGLSYSLYADPVFNKTISRRFGSEREYVDTYNSYLRGALRDSNEQGIRWYQVYSDNSTLLTSGYIDRLSDEIRQADWYLQSKASLAPYPTFVYSDHKLSLIQWLNNYPTSGIEQLIKIDLNMDLIEQKLRNSNFSGKVYLVDPRGKIQFVNNMEGAELEPVVQFDAQNLPRNALLLEVPYTDINYLEGWKLQGILDESIVLKEVQKSRAFVVWLACINFIVPTLIIAYVSRSLNVRLVRILKYMKKVKNQDFQVIPADDARDEIGQLTIEFNRMTETIKNLINEVYVADIQKKDLELKQQQAQLHALYSQINPHFLFNVLESIRMRSIIKGEKETAKIIQNMATVFRKSISWNRNVVTVQEELELISTFLDIQQYRFGDKLQYSIVADPAILQHKIPKMIFLPFIENASIHGVESSPTKGIITIHVSQQQERLHFTVEDNGIGITAPKLEELKHYLQENDDMGEKVGMKNALNRLKLSYHQSFTFAIHSQEGEGTTIQITIPLAQGKLEDN
ncbi:two-component system sensor histidine kinase YesM [Paenibacillus turicensis]|uniref:Two-component system sensor histidine kinase YesM n=1 Tax=Paenibacillus turicensis TaxID=160487 RepID=A0ABS4FRC8_9BACL|nr:sensor histidine kinase [Paenibacillus turicensis]MBP1905137.1 two-component system sensor histidine kinase YesM [Paenibacillus turicensis]